MPLADADPLQLFGPGHLSISMGYNMDELGQSYFIRKKNRTNLEDLAGFVQNEMACSGQVQGYWWLHARVVKRIHVLSQDMIRQLIKLFKKKILLIFLPQQRLQEEITKMSPTLNRNALYIKSVSPLFAVIFLFVIWNCQLYVRTWVWHLFRFSFLLLVKT